MHGLERFCDGSASFFTAREPAWHRLGTVTRNALSAHEALKVARLNDWHVMRRPIFTTGPEGQPVPGERQVRDGAPRPRPRWA